MKAITANRARPIKLLEIRQSHGNSAAVPPLNVDTGYFYSMDRVGSSRIWDFVHGETETRVGTEGLI